MVRIVLQSLLLHAYICNSGASISLVMVTILSPVLLFAYIKWRKLHTQTWGGWSFECLTEWWQFLRLGVPGIFSLAFEWWSFEITTLVAGSISTTELTISSTILQLATIFYMVSYATQPDLRVPCQQSREKLKHEREVDRGYCSFMW